MIHLAGSDVLITTTTTIITIIYSDAHVMKLSANTSPETQYSFFM